MRWLKEPVLISQEFIWMLELTAFTVIQNFPMEPLSMIMKIVGSASLLALVASQAIAATDISGIQIGSPLSTQKTAIAKINPSYQLNDIKRKSGETIGTEAIAKKDGKVIDQFVALQNDAGIIWLVARAQALEKGARIKMEVFLNSLKDKYGAHTGSILASDDLLEWQFDRQGKLFPRQTLENSGPCYDLQYNGAKFGKITSAGIEVPHKFPQNCGTAIIAHASEDRDGMISAFSVQIVDSKRMYDEIKEKELAKQNEIKQKLEEEESRNIKPNL